MTTLTAVTWVAACLLMLAGGTKVTQPSAAGVALQTIRLPSGARPVRMLGAGEIGLGILVLVLGGAAVTAVLAVIYAVFALVARRQQRAGSDCGCFGQSATPVTGLHIGLNVVVAVASLAATLRPAPALAQLVLDEPLVGVPVVVLVAVAASVLRLLLTAANDLRAAVALSEPEGAT